MKNLKKLNELLQQINNINPHEDNYTFNIVVGSPHTIIVKHNYTNKTGTHPESILFHAKIDEENFDEIFAQIKKVFLDRARSLADFKKLKCEEINKHFKEQINRLSEKIAIYEQMQKL